MLFLWKIKNCSISLKIRSHSIFFLVFSFPIHRILNNLMKTEKSPYTCVLQILLHFIKVLLQFPPYETVDFKYCFWAYRSFSYKCNLIFLHTSLYLVIIYQILSQKKIVFTWEFGVKFKLDTVLTFLIQSTINRVTARQFTSFSPLHWIINTESYF